MAGSINTKAAMGPVMEFVKDHEREIAVDYFEHMQLSMEPRAGRLDFGRLRLAFFQLTGRWPVVTAAGEPAHD